MKQTFSTFVVGKNSAQAFDASVYFSQYPEDCPNPLCIFGPAGVGKTHLLRAIEHTLQRRHSGKVTYLESGKYLDEATSQIRQGDYNYFLRRFDSGIVLLDQAERFFRSHLSQDILEYLLLRFIKNNCKIVIAGIADPKDVLAFQQMLKNLLEKGFICQIRPPGLAERLNLSCYFDRLDSIPLSRNSIMRIAQSSKLSTRGLHGAILTAKKVKEWSPSRNLAR